MKRLVAVIAVIFFGCSSDPVLPHAGDPCTMAGTGTCSDNVTALLCQGTTMLLTPIPCRGPAGCTFNNQALNCDMTLDVNGDPCPTIDENKAECDQSHAPAGYLVCTRGTWFGSSCDAGACTVSSNTLVCQ